MEAALFIYAASVLGNLQGLFAVVAIAFFIFGGAILLFLWSETYNKEELAKLRNFAKRWAVISAVLSVTAAVLPSGRTVWLMAGAYAGQKAVQSELAEDVYEIIKANVKKHKEEVIKELAK